MNEQPIEPEDNRLMRKQDMVNAFDQLIPHLVNAMEARLAPRFNKIEADVAGLKQDVAGLKQNMAEMKQDMAEMKNAMAQHPTKTEVRQIVREELDKNLSTEKFQLVRVT